MRPLRLVLGGVAVLGLVAVAWVLFRAFGVSTEVGYGARGYVVQSDRLVQVVFEVDKDPGATALCAVRSRDRDGFEVGNALVRVGPAEQRRTVVTYDLMTSARGATGELASCTLAASGS